MTIGKRALSLITVIVLLLTALSTSCSAEAEVDTLTYAVFPYLPDSGYYQELIEKRWAEIEPDIRLIRAEWDSYQDGEPAGIDVIMYDAVVRDKLIREGWIQPIDAASVQQPEDIFPYALESLTVDGRLYGIPVFLCGNFLIYDRSCDILAKAEHITDLDGESELLVISLEDPHNMEQFMYEILVDVLGDLTPSSFSGAEDILTLLDQLAIDEYKGDSFTQLAAVYDAGIGSGYLSFSESMLLLNDRISQTDIKSIRETLNKSACAHAKGPVE